MDWPRFVFWLGQTLDAEGFTAIPAKDIAAAQGLIREHWLAVDILVIDALVPGAAEFVRSLRDSRPQLRAIGAIPEHWEGVPLGFEADVVFEKTPHFTENSARHWSGLIRSLASGNPATDKAS